MADANMYIMNPVFQAESFNEMVQPLTLYALAYKEQEAKIEDMTDKAAALEWIANQNPESQTAALYRDMSEKIKGIRDDMMINGLQGGTRSRILGARKMYSANSAEITRRYEDMKKYQERMEQMYDKDNSMVFSPESLNVSLDSFAGGKRPKIKAISGNEVMARGAAAGKRFTSQVFGDGVIGKEMGDQFWKVYKEQGMNDDALAAALDAVGKGDKYPMLKKIMDNTFSSFEGFSNEDQQNLRNKWMEGFYSGSTYTRDVSWQQNLNFESDAAKATRLFNEEMGRAQLQLSGLTSGYTYDPETKSWNLDTDALNNMYTIAAIKSGKVPGASYGSGSVKATVFKPGRMTGNDHAFSDVFTKNGIFVDENEKPIPGSTVQIVPDANSTKDATKLDIICNNVVIATYDLKNRKLKDINPDNKGKIKSVLDIPGNPFHGNRWRYSDDKNLRALCERARDMATNSPVGYSVLNNYEFRFESDGTDPRESWLTGARGHNGSVASLPLDREAYTAYDYGYSSTDEEDSTYAH